MFPCFKTIYRSDLASCECSAWNEWITLLARNLHLGFPRPLVLKFRDKTEIWTNLRPEEKYRVTTAYSFRSKERNGIKWKCSGEEGTACIHLCIFVMIVTLLRHRDTEVYFHFIQCRAYKIFHLSSLFNIYLDECKQSTSLQQSSPCTSFVMKSFGVASTHETLEKQRKPSQMKKLHFSMFHFENIPSFPLFPPSVFMLVPCSSQVSISKY